MKRLFAKFGAFIVVCGTLTSCSSIDECVKTCPANQKAHVVRWYFFGTVIADEGCHCDGSTSPVPPPSSPGLETCAGSGPALTKDQMTVHFKGLYVIDTENFEVGDKVCNTCIGQIALSPQGDVTRSICRNSSGNGEIKVRELPNGQWITYSWISDSNPDVNL